MKILLVCYNPPNGGGGVTTLYLARELARKGHTAIICSTEKYPGISTELIWPVRKLPFFGWRDRLLQKKLSTIIEKNQIDLVLCLDYRFFGLSSMRAARQAGIPIAIYYQDYWFKCLKGDLLYRNREDCAGSQLTKCLSCQSRWRMPWETYKYYYFKKRFKIIRSADANLTVSQFVADHLRAEGVDSDPTVVYNLIDELPRAREPLNEEILRFIKGKLVVTFIGRLIFHRGIDSILSLARDMSGKHEEIAFLMAGEGELALYCDKFIKEQGLKNIRHLGQIRHDDMRAVYDGSDIVLFPSLIAEPCARVVAEAMRHGKVVIASDRGGHKEIVKPGEDGYLVDPGNVLRMRELILRLAKDRDKRERIGELAKQNAKRFSSRSVGNKIEKIIKKINEKKDYHIIP